MEREEETGMGLTCCVEGKVMLAYFVDCWLVGVHLVSEDR